MSAAGAGAPATLIEDQSAVELLIDRVNLLLEHDPRRKCEFVPVYQLLRREGETYSSTPVDDANGEPIRYWLPHPRLVALYAALLLRHRLNLPTMASPTV